MPVGLSAPGNLFEVEGIRLSAVHSGIKVDPNCTDLVLIEIAEAANISAVFTTNRFCAAPVTLAREHLAANPATRYLIINSGNANAGTGQEGYQRAVASCCAVAETAEVASNSVLPFSTGVIATALPVDKIVGAVPGLFAQLDGNAWLNAAKGIMTTDTLPKAFSRKVEIGEKTLTITGIAKGSGMIKPDMATMLAYIATDAAIDAALLDEMHRDAVSRSFNAITVDGDTSTNDACILMATGRSNVQITNENIEFKEALVEIYQSLAQAIIRDAEGATKFVEIAVRSAQTMSDARAIAYAVAQSPLVKTALFASDPNWGRILAAIGRAEASGLDIKRVNLILGDTPLLVDGLPDPSYREEMGQSEMAKSDIKIRIELGLGDYDFQLWTSDLSYEYVRINAEYRS